MEVLFHTNWYNFITSYIAWLISLQSLWSILQTWLVFFQHGCFTEGLETNITNHSDLCNHPFCASLSTLGLRSRLDLRSGSPECGPRTVEWRLGVPTWGGTDQDTKLCSTILKSNTFMLTLYSPVVCCLGMHMLFQKCTCLPKCKNTNIYIFSCVTIGDFSIQ